VSLKYLLDSNIVSEPTRPSPNPHVLGKLREHRGELGIASVAWHEMLFGVERLPQSRKRTAIEDYLFEVVRANMSILPYDATAAEWHASQRARLTAIGKTPSFIDGQIAAVAKVNGLVMVTANRAHFERFEGLPIEDWRE